MDKPMRKLHKMSSLAKATILYVLGIICYFAFFIRATKAGCIKELPEFIAAVIFFFGSRFFYKKDKKEAR